jgi:membrane associated rhomboid family serine protease
VIPIRDENPTLRTPVVTIALIVATSLVWILVQGAGFSARLPQSICELGLIPGELTGSASERAIELGPQTQCVLSAEPHWYTLLTSMFMHGSWFHLIGNMWFLWIFGNNVEDSMGRGRFVLFYLLSGSCAAAAQILTDPSSPIPMVGASGAIGGVMGAYVVLYPRVAVDLLVFLGFFVTTVRVPAFLMLGYWFVLQLLGGLPQLGGGQGGVAFWAHVGGFVAGAGLVFLFRNRDLVARHREALETVGGWRQRPPRPPFHRQRRDPW